MAIKKNFTDSFKYSKFFPQLKKEKAQKFTTLILTFFAFSFFGLFAINPTLSTIAQLKKELADNQFVNQRLEEKKTNLIILQQKYNNLSQNLPLIMSAMPENPSITLIIGQIQTIAKSNNVNLINIQTFEIELLPKKDKSGNILGNNDYSTFIFNLGVEGSYGEISNFLSDLVNFNRIITIESLAINKNSSTGLLQVFIKGKVYYKR